jgi:hypothetical protein
MLEMRIETHLGPQINSPLMISDLMPNWDVSTDVKLTNIKFHRNLFRNSIAVTCEKYRRAAGHGEANNGAFLRKKHKSKKGVTCLIGSAIAQAVSRWLPTAAARLRVRGKHVRFVVDKVALGEVFSEYFGFPCQSSFHQFLLQHNHPGLAQLVAAVPRGPNWTPPSTIPIKKKLA